MTSAAENYDDAHSFNRQKLVDRFSKTSARWATRHKVDPFCESATVPLLSYRFADIAAPES